MHRGTVSALAGGSPIWGFLVCINTSQYGEQAAAIFTQAPSRCEEPQCYSRVYRKRSISNTLLACLPAEEWEALVWVMRWLTQRVPMISLFGDENCLFEDENLIDEEHGIHTVLFFCFTMWTLQPGRGYVRPEHDVGGVLLYLCHWVWFFNQDPELLHRFSLTSSED